MELSFRDRFFTPKVARAIVSPGAIVSTAAGASVGILTGNAVVAVGLAVAGFVTWVAAAIPRKPRKDRIDPFTLSEPWRRLTTETLAARDRFRNTVRRTEPGPIRERLDALVDQIDESVDEAWETARAGHALSDAYGRIDAAAVGRELERVRSASPSDARDRTLASLERQLDTATRMRETVTTTEAQLRLLNERLDESVAQCIELSVGIYQPERFDQVSGSLVHINDELEALRGAVAETRSWTQPAAMPEPTADAESSDAQPSGESTRSEQSGHPGRQGQQGQQGTA